MFNINILAISGSPRRESSVGMLLRTIATFAPENVQFTFYDRLIDLPHFSPELDTDSPPATVVEIRSLIRNADGIIICTPEYAFSMPSVLKNLLEWDVSSADLYKKPTIALSLSPNFGGGAKALDSLLIVLGAIGARIPEGGTLSVSNIRKRMTEDGEIIDPELTRQLEAVLKKLFTEIEASRKEN